MLNTYTKFKTLLK